MVMLALSAQGPVAIRYNRGALASRPVTVPIKIGVWEETGPIDNARVVVIASGRMVETALKAAEGLPAAVVNARCLKPMDEALLKRIAQHGAPVITLEDGVVIGGFGEAVKAMIGSAVPVVCCGVGQEPVRHASVKEQDALCGISQEDVRKKIMDLLENAK